MKKKLLIIGHARHGKDTVAELIHIHCGYSWQSSSQAAVDIFIYEALKEKYGYSSPLECFEDRIHHRAEWHNLILKYNQDDKSRLAKEILKTSDIYVGMRSAQEVQTCIDEELFDLIIGVYDPRKELESKYSFDLDLWEIADIVIPNASNIYDLDARIIKLKGLL